MATTSICNEPAPEIIVHGTFLNIYGVGVLITGEPGIGKSELALGLISRNHQLIADDAPYFSLENNCLIGKNPLKKVFLSVRGIGLIDVGLIFGQARVKMGHTLDLIIHLQLGEASNTIAHLKGQHSIKDILGCLIPCVTIPIIIPRNLEVLVEIIVKKYLLELNKEGASVGNFEELLQEKMETFTS
ncbi:MAG: hypothetical protein H0U71_06840 [Gammaproteobacteria bacterium]|nr:hypothetical protein [Gammaproteobacteria bacterium]